MLSSSEFDIYMVIGHCIAIIILCSRLTLWHIFMLSSSCEFESDGYCSTDTSTCYHLESSTDTSSCYHHLIIEVVTSTDTFTVTHRHAIIILWVRQTNRQWFGILSSSCEVRHSCRLAQGVALLSSSSIVKPLPKYLRLLLSIVLMNLIYIYIRALPDAWKTQWKCDVFPRHSEFGRCLRWTRRLVLKSPESPTT